MIHSQQFVQSFEWRTEFFKLDTGCNVQLIDCRPKNYPDMFAFHPDGRFVGANKYLGGRDSIDFMEFDLGNCFKGSKISSYYEPGTRFYFFYYIDYRGRFYVSGINNIKRTKFLYRLTGIDSLVREILLEYPISKSFIYDIAFLKNEIYLTGIEDQNYIIKCDTNFNILDQYPANNVIHSMSTFPVNCDSTVTLCSGYDIQLNEIGSVVKDTFLFFYYDLKNNRAIDTLCTQKLVTGLSNLSSPLEFLSSDPECDLLIDLDRNNNSGLYPYNFKWKDVYCDQFSFVICDEDTYIHTSFSLDSITLELMGILDPGEEWLDGNQLNNGFSLAQRSDSLYVLLSGNDRSDVAYVNALKELMYIHSGLNPTSGQRLIKINGYNVIKKGVDVYSYFTISTRPDAGKDTSLLLCDQYLNSDLSSLLNASSNQGSWIPALQSGNNSFDSQQDSLSLYHYILSDTYCGSDTAVLRIVKDQYPILELGPDVELCKEDTLVFKLTKPINGMIKWNDGDTSSVKTLDKFGKYWVSIISEFGCLTTDSISFKPSNEFEHIVRSEQICSNKNFSYKNKIYYPNQTVFDTLKSLTGCDTILQIDLLPVDLPSITSQFKLCIGDSLNYRGKFYYPGDSLSQIRMSIDEHCDTLETIVVHKLSLPDINLYGDSILCPSQRIQLVVNWNENLIWSDGQTTPSIWVDQPGVYRVIATDAHGCSSSAEYNIKNAVNLEYELLIQDPNCAGEASGSIDLKEFNPIPGIDKIEINGKMYNSWPVHSLASGQYQIRIIDQQGCEYDRLIELKEPEVLSPGLPAKLELKLGELKTLRLSSQAPRKIININIYPNEGIEIKNDSTIIVTGIKDSEYAITVTDENGCEYIYSLALKINENQEIFLPNAFSPNGDQINDWFYPQSGLNLFIEQMLIFDRWGNIIFQSNNFETNQSSKGWNGLSSGKACNPGVYIYLIKYLTRSDQNKIIQGEVNLLR